MPNNRWVVLALVMVTTTIGMTAFAANYPLLNLWIQDLGISRAQGGIISGLWYLPGVLISLPIGWAFDRYPIRRVLLPCWALIVVGIGLMAVASSFWGLAAGRLVFSIGMNAHMIGAPKLLGATFAGRRELGFVMGIYTISFTAGVWLSLNVLASAAASDGWHGALQVLTAACAGGAALLLLLPRPATIAEGAAPRFNPLSLGAGAWILALGYAGYSIGTEGILSFGPDMLVGRGFPLTEASAIVGSYALVALILKPAFSSQLRPATAAGFVVVATLLALVAAATFFGPGIAPRGAAAVFGVSLALAMPALLAMPAFLFAADRSGQVYGLYQALYSLGFLGQPLVGQVVDATGSYPAGFVVIGLYCVLGLLVLAPAVRRLRPE
ncbi:MAG: MFS transporter [Gemmatimonadetes bacterium]|nr:MFS transporter [Gemmatimonadota bacterium]